MYYIPIKNEKISKLNPKELRISKKNHFIDFFKIIELNTKIEFKSKLEYLMKYYYTFKMGIDKEPLFYFNVDEAGKIVETECLICLRSACHHLNYAINNVSEELETKIKDSTFLKTREEEINELIIHEKNRLEELELKAKRNAQLFKVQNLLEVINKQDVTPLASKVLIYPIINFVDTSDNLKIYLELKVGIDKMYTVTKIDSFISAINNNEEVSYGKLLAFKHSLENFDDAAIAVIDILNLRKQRSKNEYNYYSNYKSIRIDLIDVEKIIDAYTSRNIEINGLDKDHLYGIYYVSSETIKVDFKLKNNYSIALKGLENGITLDCINKSYYLFNNMISLVTFPEANMRPLYQFIKENKNFSFSLIKDVLSKEILARFYDHLEFDEKVKPELEFKDLRIEAYFDLDHDILKLNTKYYYDDNLIDINKISDNKYFSLKIDKYNLAIKSLGFEADIIKEAGKIYNFLKLDLTNLKLLATVYLSDRLSKMQAKTYKPMSMNLTYNTNMLSVCFNESEYTDEELASIVKGLRKKTRYIKLKNNVILEINEKDGEALLNTIEEFNLDINSLLQNQLIPAYQALKLYDKNINIINYNEDNKLIDLLKDISNYKESNYEIPLHLKDVMRSYQKEAFLWMKTLIKYNFSGILADDMGLGKTLEMISVIISDQVLAPSIIVCPKSLSYNWKNEFDLWAPNIKVVNIIGGSSEREDLIKNIKNDEAVIYITSYDSLRNDIDFYNDKKFLYAVLDEGQFIKNHETLKAQSVKNINSKYRFVLTGTPIENTVIDLWSIFDFLMPGYLSNITKFKSEYEKAIIERKDSNTIDKLVQKISPFILRRVKEDVIKDLPEKTYLIQAAKMTDEQKMVYDAQLKRTREILESSDNKIELLACITRLRQICVDPSMFLDNYKGGSGKVELALELIEEYIEGGHKILIFSQFTSVFNVFEQELKSRKIDYFILTGKTDAASRVEMASIFNVSEKYKVFLVSLKAGGTGLNLTGADIVIHLDPWWNVAAENQATDRSHRIGQTKVVQVVKMVSEDSIEQKVIELQERKQEIAKLIVADDDSNIQKLTKDDISFILN